MVYLVEFRLNLETETDANIVEDRYTGYRLLAALIERNTVDIASVASDRGYNYELAEEAVTRLVAQIHQVLDEHSENADLSTDSWLEIDVAIIRALHQELNTDATWGVTRVSVIPRKWKPETSWLPHLVGLLQRRCAITDAPAPWKIEGAIGTPHSELAYEVHIDCWRNSADDLTQEIWDVANELGAMMLPSYDDDGNLYLVEIFGPGDATLSIFIETWYNPYEDRAALRRLPRHLRPPPIEESLID